MMETTVDIGLGREALRLYLSEVKDSQLEIEFEEEEHLLLDEVEQATDFLQKAGLSNLSKAYHEGQEITETMVNDSVRQRNLTEKQAQTVRSRVKTLNKTLRSHQPRRKQRQDVRDVAWNAETSSTGTRSRSATPDSLDSAEAIHEDLTSDEDQQLSLPPFPLDSENMVFKGQLKWTSSEPLQKFSRADHRGDIAHLGSENVILKGYQPLNEFGTLTRRERSGSDPTTDVLNSIENHNSDTFINQPVKLHSKLSRSHNSLIISSNSDEPVCLMGDGGLSFEGLLKQNQDPQPQNQSTEFRNSESVCVDELTDSQYQHLKLLLWVEVTAIFDQYNIIVLKRKSSTKSKRGNVFGVNLSTLVMRDMPRPTDNSMVPQVFQSIVHQLNTRCLEDDGIIRIAGQQHRLNYLSSEIEAKFYNNRKHVENLLSQATGHELTSILKKLLRDLPDTIFTMELFDMFYKCSMIPSCQDRLTALNLLVLLLPVEHRNTFRLLMQFCINVINHKDQNRMSLHNVSTITAPTFFSQKFPKDIGKMDKVDLKSTKTSTKETNYKYLHDTAVYCCIMEQMLKCGDTLWMVPFHLAQQAKEAQRRAQDRKDLGKERRLVRGILKW